MVCVTFNSAILIDSQAPHGLIRFKKTGNKHKRKWRKTVSSLLLRRKNNYL